MKRILEGIVGVKFVYLFQYQFLVGAVSKITYHQEFDTGQCLVAIQTKIVCLHQLDARTCKCFVFSRHNL